MEDTELHCAVRLGDLDETLEALKMGHSPNTLGLFCWSPLHDAASQGRADILKVLLDAGASHDLRCALKGFTALHYAAKADDASCATLLLDAGAHWNARSSCGEKLTCLEVAGAVVRNLFLMQVSILSVDEYEKSDDSNSMSTSVLSQMTTDNSEKGSSNGSSFHSKHLATHVGFLELSFEFHAKIEELKVRLWSLTNLLLPSSKDSQISTMYVKGILRFFSINKSRQKMIKYKSELVPTFSKNGLLNTHNCDYTDTVAEFSFSQPLVFSGVKPADVLADATLEICLCARQRLTLRSYALASVHLLLKDRISCLERQSVPLESVIQKKRSLPRGMRVYGASQDQKARLPLVCSTSQPELRRRDVSLQSNDDCCACGSEGDLNEVIVSTREKLTSHVSIPMSDFAVSHSSLASCELEMPLGPLDTSSTCFTNFELIPSFDTLASKDAADAAFLLRGFDDEKGFKRRVDEMIEMDEMVSSDDFMDPAELV